MALTLLAVTSGGIAQVMTPSEESLTLPSAVAKALVNNPTLKTYGFEARISEARILQAGIQPNPEVSIAIENFLGTRHMSGVKGLETTLQLSQVIDLGGSISKRVDAAMSASKLTDADYEIKRLEVLAEVARRFTETAADAAKLESARRAREVGESAVVAVQKRVEAAIANPIELLKVRNALGLLEIEEEHAEHELLAHRQNLAAVMGLEEAKFGPIQADLLNLPEVPEFSVLTQRLEKSPALARYKVEARWRTAQIGLAQSLRRAGAAISGGLRRNEETNSFGFLAGISMPLAIRDVNVGDIREARELRDQTEANAEVARLEMRATLYEVYQEMIHARTVVQILQQKLIPTAEQTTTLTEAGYNNGRFSIIELLDAQKSLIELQQLLVSSATSYHLHTIEIERLLGAPLQDPASTI